MKCMILAGGFATRLYPLTINRAKALLPYKGRPLISYLVDKIPRSIDIYVTTNIKFKDEFEKWEESLNRDINLCIEDAADDKHKMGAISAIDYWINRHGIENDLLVLAGDNYFEFDLRHFISRFDGKNTLIAVYDVVDKEKACEGRPCQVGLAVMEGNRVIRFDEKPQEATSSLVATGVYILPKRVFPLLSDFCSSAKRDNMGSFISYLVGVDRVNGFKFRKNWIDISDELTRQFQAVPV